MTGIVRTARLADLDQLEVLIRDVDRGMLTMPANRAQMEDRILRSQEAFARESAPPDGENYFLVLEEGADLVHLPYRGHL